MDNTSKFRPGDKVRRLINGQVYTVLSVKAPMVEICPGYWLHEINLKPYSASYATNVASSVANESSKETDMEKNPLNLAELLKGCEGEKIYLPDEGAVTIIEVTEREIVARKSNGGTTHLLSDSLYIQPTGFAYIYPSKESYLAHPLDAKKAWQEWAEARRPKRWIPKHGDKVWCLNISLNPMWEINNLPSSKWVDELNCFRTEDLCKQAAEAVRETLMKFHEKHPQV